MAWLVLSSAPGAWLSACSGLSARSGYSYALDKVLACTVSNGDAGAFAQLAIRPLGHRHFCPGALLLAIAGTCWHRKIPLPWWGLLPKAVAALEPVPQLQHGCEVIALTPCIPVPKGL